MRIGMVCPYSFDVPGGVQSHVLQLAEGDALPRARRQRAGAVVVGKRAARLRRLGRPGRPHSLQRIGGAAAVRPGHLPQGQEVALRRRFRRAAPARAERPQLVAAGVEHRRRPIVATFHTSATKSVALSVLGGMLRPRFEKIVGRIAVSDLARRWQMESLGSDAVEIPNGVDVDFYASAPMMDGYPRPGKTVLFLGRFDEPRKGMSTLLEAMPTVIERFPDVQLLIVGRGDDDELRSQASEFVEHIRILGQVDDDGKASAMCSADVYCAPNTGGESFGIVLVEAMAAGTAVVASDLDAFRRVLEDGEVGRLVPVDDATALAEALITVLDDDALRKRYVVAAREAVRRYDWSVVASQIMRVYETVAGAGVKVQVATDGVADRRVCPAVRGAGRLRGLGVSAGEPIEPAACALRPVLAGTGRGVGPARGGGPRDRDRRVRQRARGQTVGGAGRRRRAGAPAVHARPRRTNSPRRWRWWIRRRCRPGCWPSWPTPRPGYCWPAGSTTTRCETPWCWPSGGWCGCSIWVEGAAANVFRDRRTAARTGARPSRAQPPHLGAGGAARRIRCRAVAVRLGSRDRQCSPVVVHRRR